MSQIQSRIAITRVYYQSKYLESRVTLNQNKSNILIRIFKNKPTCWILSNSLDEIFYDIGKAYKTSLCIS